MAGPGAVAEGSELRRRVVSVPEDTELRLVAVRKIDVNLLRPARLKVIPRQANWGGLSGCTYSEGVSWGKFMPKSEGGRFAEVYSDATLVWPLLIKAVLEELEAA